MTVARQKIWVFLACLLAEMWLMTFFPTLAWRIGASSLCWSFGARSWEESRGKKVFVAVRGEI
jgi:hypothetical protein